jgi:hypothetical protein
MKQRLPVNLQSPAKSMTHLVRRDVVLPDALFFRAAQQSDENFVFHSFIESVKTNCQIINTRPPQGVRLTDMRRCYEQILRHLLNKGAGVAILADSSEADNIAGWICFERQQRRVCLHYLYVKTALRELGYATFLYRFATRELTDDDTVYVSLLSPVARNILNAKKVPFQHRPELLFAANTFQTIEDQHAQI